MDLWATANTFRKGHRIRVAVTSSSFPRFDRNLNTGGPTGAEARGQVALNTDLPRRAPGPPGSSCPW